MNFKPRAIDRLSRANVGTRAESRPQRGTLKTLTTVVLGGALVLSMGFPAVADDLPQHEDVVAPQSLKPVEDSIPAQAEPAEETGVPAEQDSLATNESAETPEQHSEDLEAELLQTADGEESLAPQSLNPQAVDIMQLSSTLSCAANTFYSVSNGGTLMEIVHTANNSSTRTTLEGGWLNTVEVNGLAIDAGGHVAYAVDRSGTTVRSILRYFPASGTWERIANSGSSTNVDRGIIAGAMDLSTGKFLFGGFNAPRNLTSTLVFHLYEYDPSTNQTTLKGTFDTGIRGWSWGLFTGWTPTPANGDMAFDDAGNLYIVRSGTDTQIYTITAQNLQNASGGSLPFTATTPRALSGQSNVNGVAFDQDGTVYLANTTTAKRYNSSDWTLATAGNVTAALNDSTDLASCQSPANLTLRKNVEGRIVASDQFTLQLHDQNTLIGEVTTAGTENGIQPQQVGPVPVITNREYRISELLPASGSQNYHASWQCVRGDTNTVFASGNGVNGTLTVPNVPSISIECTFTNTPAVADVVIRKQLLGADGTTLSPLSGWPVTAVLSEIATTGVTINPTGADATQNTSGPDASAQWTVRFPNLQATSGLQVSETMQHGYEFVSATCTIERPANGTTTTQTVTLTGVSGLLEDITGGDHVDCTFVNRLKPAEIHLSKQVKYVGQDVAEVAAGWTLDAALPSGQTGVTIENPDSKLTESDGQVEDPWKITFTEENKSANLTISEALQTGYSFASLVCDITSEFGNRIETLDAASATLVAVRPGDQVECVFTNIQQPGAVIWSKVDEGNDLLGGSEWTLTGPSPANPGSEMTIVDCVGPHQPSAEACLIDTDDRPGHFTVENLPWGAYTLVETKAPAGYLLNDHEHTFTISASDLTHAIEDGFVNVRREGPDLPLTGGLGRDVYTLLGLGTLVLGGGAAAVIRIRNRRKEVA